jgi:general secretion pathway protein E
MPRSAARRRVRAVPAPEAPDVLAILVKQGVVNEEQAERVRRAQKVNGYPAEQALVQLGVVNEVQIAQALAAESGLPYVKINPLDLDIDVVTKAVAGPFARRHGMVAIDKTDAALTFAVYNPFAPFPYEDIKRVTGLDAKRVVATQSDVESINKGFYDLKSSLKHAEKQLAESRIATVDLTNQEFLSKADADLDPAAAPVVKALDQILANAFEQRASDIHFEPKRELTLVRLRIDGVLHDVHVIPRIVYDAVVSRIKLLSGANLAEKRRPQDGRIKRDQGGREVELRVSTMPTSFGEKAVLRIFDPEVLL